MRVLIVTGGDSPERKISFLSAGNVRGALEKKGHKVKFFDLRKGLEILENELEKHDIVFPVLHGEEGEGGDLHKFLSAFKTPIVGSRNWQAFKKAWYKIPFKKFCDKNNIKTAAWKKIKKKEDLLKFPMPFVLKASVGGSSKEVVIVKSNKDLNKKLLRELVESGQALFVESFIAGVEVTVGILNNKALPVLEIVPPKGEWFDYKNKYSGETREIPNAPSISEQTRKKVKNIALDLHKKFDLGSYSRSDFIVAGNDIYVLEVNTIPGLTEQSLLPKAAKAIGISFPEFCNILVRTAK
ncbi:MAG: ATP-grasp domain-containing protein [Candidatus Levybacteria bacterium]|nr:ATP-grasp domain-containing protein [Candidatus Levybacteria bacterium]